MLQVVVLAGRGLNDANLPCSSRPTGSAAVKSSCCWINRPGDALGLPFDRSGFSADRPVRQRATTSIRLRYFTRLMDGPHALIRVRTVVQEIVGGCARA